MTDFIRKAFVEGLMNRWNPIMHLSSMPVVFTIRECNLRNLPGIMLGRQKNIFNHDF